MEWRGKVSTQDRKIIKLQTEIKDLKWKLLMVSMLAADTPQFFSPFNVAWAKNIRDEVLGNKEERNEHTGR